MKSLSTFKGMATRLQKQIANVKELVAEFKFKYLANPCKLTREALHKAEKKLVSLEEKLVNINEMINHYEFYAYCYEQEQREASGRTLFMNR